MMMKKTFFSLSIFEEFRIGLQSLIIFTISDFCLFIFKQWMFMAYCIVYEMLQYGKSQFHEAQDGIFKCLIQYDQQFRTQTYSIELWYEIIKSSSRYFLAFLLN